MDDVAIELVEEKLVKVLPDIFSPMTVFTMSPDLVGCIAGESDEKLRQREQLEKKLDVLRKCSNFCKRFVGVKVAGETHDRVSALCRKGEMLTLAADMTVGARGAERTSVSVPVSPEEVASPLGAVAPTSEVHTDLALPSHEHSGPAERIASPDFTYYWSEQPAPPVNEELLLPSSPSC